MTASLRVAAVEMESIPDPGENLKKSLSMLNKAAEAGAGLVIFPEYQMMVPDFHEPGSSVDYGISTRFLETMASESDRLDLAVMLNYWEYGSEKPYNASVLLYRGKEIYRYRKIHLYDAAGKKESGTFLAGEPDPRTHSFSGFRVGSAICYDIRFPELTQLYMREGIDLLVVQAGWYGGEGKLDSWLSILRTRAIETGCFVMAAAQCGPLFTGHSVAFDPYGRILAEAPGAEGIIIASVSHEVIQRYRAMYPLAEQKRINCGKTG